MNIVRLKVCSSATSSSVHTGMVASEKTYSEIGQTNVLKSCVSSKRLRRESMVESGFPVFWKVDLLP
jgi:hypothetical protein